MNFLKMTKKQTGIFFILAYAIALVVGVAVFLLLESILKEQILLLTFIANLAMTIVIFTFSLWTKNSSMYDPYWSVIPPIIIIGWMIYHDLPLNIVNGLLLIGISIWAIRLTYNWWKNWTGFKEQDWRYDLIKEKTKGFYLLSNFGAIHLIPTLVVYIQLINGYFIINANHSLNILIVIGFLLMLFASGIQYIADQQMYDFRQNRKSKNQVIDQGLWHYSRHPNYLGELSLWVGVYLMYLGIQQTLDFNIIYPLAMISLFVFVSIPMMEKKLENRPGYRQYKNQVSMLIPYRKKSDSKEVNELN